MRIPRFLLPVLALIALHLPAGAQTIVLTGDDLVAIAAAASDGDVLEIHSNATFVGTLSWLAKSITIQAGAGFAPTIKGSPGDHVANLHSASPPTKATFKSLTLERGDDAIDPFTGLTLTPAAFAFSGTGSAPVFTKLDLEDCTVIGDLTSSGTGLHRFTGIANNTNFQHTLLLGGTGDLVQSMTVNDCSVAGKIRTIITGNAQVTLDVARTRIETAIQLEAISNSALAVTVESSLIASNGASSFGILTSQNTTATFTNVTVTGFTTGLIGSAGTQWHNMLLAGNTSDLSSVSSNEISDSLIESGTYDGLNGNFTGTALMDAAGNLLACSSGIDAGNNAAPNLGATDLNGAPRIKDNDGNGIATVNVGATEPIGTIAGTSITSNGNGINPLDFFALSLPAAGANFDTKIATPAGTALTIVAYDAPAPTAFLLPGLVGEVQIAVTPNLILDFANGLHSEPIPADCALVGVAISAQGFRAMTASPSLIVDCLNRLDLVIGG